MSAIATAIVGGAVISGVANSRAASKASKAQQAASDAGIAETSRQFDKVQELLKPYVDAGNSSLAGQQDLLGLNGPGAQQAAIDLIKQSPEFTSLVQQGEEGILQNASATGGLRGGNVQAALGQFRPQVLAQLLNDRFAKLGSLTGIGQASAAGTGAAAQQSGSDIANLLAQSGQAKAGAALANGRAVSDFTNSLSSLAVLKGMKVF